MTALPVPLAVAGAVTIHPDEPTLIVKPAEARGHSALLWRQGHRAMMEAERRGRYGAPTLWASGAGRYEIARGHPWPDGSLRFRFRPGDPVYRQLTTAPGLHAFVVVDGTHPGILSCQVPGG